MRAGKVISSITPFPSLAHASRDRAEEPEIVKLMRAMAYPSTFTFLQQDLARYFRGVDHRSAGLLTETNPKAMKFSAAEMKGRPRFSQGNLCCLYGRIR